METPLLQTKLYIPPSRPELVARPRLLERLNEGLHRKLTLISAPAGFGKTTLVSSWIYELRAGAAGQEKIVNPKSKIENQVAWLSLDNGDNDPARFFTYLIAALQQIKPTIGASALALLTASQTPPIEMFMTTLINEIAAGSTYFVLVLDDYQFIETAAIHHALSFLLDHLPPQLHVVITTRADPPLPLARLRGRGQLLELRQAELRFTLEEAAAFLNQVMGLNLSASEVETLENRTEGWITGLQLAAISMQGSNNPADFINSFSGSHRYIFDYLADEILNRQPQPVKEFLLHTSILNLLTAPLCNAVTQRRDSRAILNLLDTANMFIIPLDDRRQWYRYHHLFAEALRGRLSRMGVVVSDLHHRAGEWFEQNIALARDHEFIAAAINHALAAEDFERVARLIAQTAQSAVWQRGEINTVLSWLDRLPRQAEQAWPQLSLTHALLLAWRQQFEVAELLLQEVIESTQTLPGPERDNFLGQAATIRATIANLQGDDQQAMGYAQEALEFLPEDNVQSRGISLGILGGIYRARGEVNAGLQAYTEAATRLQAAGQGVPALIALAYLGQLHVLGGQLNQANATYQQAFHLADTWQAQEFPTLGVVHISLGDLLRERNELETAVHHLQQGLELCARWAGLGDDIFDGYLSLARIRQAQGRPEDASTLIQKAKQAGQNHNVPDWATFTGVCQAWLWLAQGNLSALQQWVAERGLQLDDPPGSYPSEIEYLTLARLYLAEARFDETLSLLQALRQTAEASGRTGRLIEILILQALAFYYQSDITQALLTLSQAITLAEPEGYLRIFVDEGPPMVALLRRAHAQGIAPNYISKLLEAFTDLQLGSAHQPEIQNPKSQTRAERSRSIQNLIEPLTPREQEVLQLMAAGRSNPQIAAELVISVTTVKTHVKNIYGKLNTNNRFQAVARARELNLL